MISSSLSPPAKSNFLLSKSKEEKIALHRSSLERNNDKPLNGCIRGRGNLDRYVEDTESFYPKREVLAGDVTGERFLPVYESWTRKLQDDDDLFRTLETLPFFPWAEAATGCKTVTPGNIAGLPRPGNCKIASQADYTLFALHATGLHLLDILLGNRGIIILQVSKDEGVAPGRMLPDLKKIQTAGKYQLLKGRFSREEAGLIRKNLNAEGLCVQAVVTTHQEEEDSLADF